VDESKQFPPPSDSNPSWSFGRKSFSPPSSPQLSFLGASDKRTKMPMANKSSLDISYSFPTKEPPSPSVPTLRAECEAPQDSNTAPRRSFSLFRRMTGTQTSSSVPSTPKPARYSWRRFSGSSGKASAQGMAVSSSNEVIKSSLPEINRVPPRPTRPIPPVPQESPPTTEFGESNKRTNARRYHNRSASLQETHALPEPPSLMVHHRVRRGGGSLDMNHIFVSAETSTRSSHNLLDGTEERRERTRTVRELAITPAQRAVRYVLLFKG
jgi:hypothetical protein